MTTHEISSKKITLSDFVKICQPDSKLFITKKVEDKVRSCELAVRKLINENKIIYGVNTGVGDLCNCVLKKDELTQLQKNLVLSHACGGEPYLEQRVARGALFLVTNARAKGYSGGSLGIIEKLVKLFNANVSPMLPVHGSLGASGDLVPLAHLALVLLGKGKAYENGKVKSSSSVIRRLGIANHHFGPKEALSLINGTDVGASYSAFAFVEAERLLVSTTRATAMLFEVLGSSRSCLDKDLHELKPHFGQKAVAKYLRDFLADSKMCDRPGGKIQEPYTVRCAPHVDGAVLDKIMEGTKVVETEINSVTDNPLFFATVGGTRVVSGGTCHAQNIAFSLDTFSIL